MNERMGWSKSREGLNVYEYHPEKGPYYHYITPSLILGSQPRTPEDVDSLCSLGVGTIVCLQEDRDLAHWGVDVAALAARAAAARPPCRLLRRPLADFDPGSLQRGVAGAVALLAEVLREEGRAVYVHCTAGLGRAPGVVVAALHWLGLADGAGRKLLKLDDAYEYVTSIRPCGPNKEALFRATLAQLPRGSAYSRTRELTEEDRAGIRRRLDELA